MILKLLAIFSLAVGTNCMYSSTSDVVDLTPSNFDKLVINSDNIWIVEFYAPWCGHCKSLKSEYDKVATALKGVVKVGAVNADEHKSLAGRFSIEGFPTIKIFGANKKSPENYNGPRNADGIATEALKVASKKVKDALGGKSSSSDSKPKDSKDVVELTDENFDKLVMGSEDMWLVEFFAPWCGHCKNLEPHWASAATELKGKVKLGALDATQHTVKASQYEIKGYPTIKFFAPGKKDSDSVSEYDGGRTSSDIVSWALDKLAENIPAPEIVELVNQKAIKTCEEKPLCVISILPHILDCQSKCRNQYLEVLKDLGEKYKKKMWGWLWAEAGTQPQLEKALEIGGFGYPALAVVNVKKMKYSLLRGSFSKTGIDSFLRDLSYGRGGTAPLKGAELPKIQEIEAWDGEDAIPPADEDIDLSDVDLGEKDEL